ncbi:hypothetical protein J6590_045910 [Homalodisca vitripennis]|nr:hypothetical protein J6590_045910 [Homalodisca vitripennis]
MNSRLISTPEPIITAVLRLTGCRDGWNRGAARGGSVEALAARPKAGGKEERAGPLRAAGGQPRVVTTHACSAPAPF